MSSGCIVFGILFAIGAVLQARQAAAPSLVIAPALVQIPLGRLALVFANGVALLAGVIALMAVLGGAGGAVAAFVASDMSDRWLAVGAAATCIASSGIVLRGVHHVQIGVREDPARVGRGLAWMGGGLTGLAAIVAAGMLPDVLRRATERGWRVETTIALGVAGAPLGVALVVAAIYAAFRDTYRALDVAVRESAPGAGERAESR